MLNGRHERWLNLCLKLVNKIEPHPYQYRHVAVLVSSGRLLSIGRNKYKSGYAKNSLYYERGIHAELDLLCKIDTKKLKNCQIYTIGITPGGRLTESCPCPVCQKLIKQYSIKGVYYLDKEMKVRQLQLEG